MTLLSQRHICQAKLKIMNSSSAVTTPLYKRNDMQSIYHVCIACTSSQPCACVISNAFTFDIKLVIFVINIISNDLQHMYINFLRVSQ